MQKQLKCMACNDMRILEDQQYFSAAHAMNTIGIYRCAIISLKDNFGK